MSYRLVFFTLKLDHHHLPLMESLTSEMRSPRETSTSAKMWETACDFVREIISCSAGLMILSDFKLQLKLLWPQAPTVHGGEQPLYLIDTVPAFSPSLSLRHWTLHSATPNPLHVWDKRFYAFWRSFCAAVSQWGQESDDPEGNVYTRM